MSPSFIACIALLSIALTLVMIVICKRPSFRLKTVLLAIFVSFLVIITIPNIYWMSYRAYPGELATVFMPIAAAWVIFPKKPWIQCSGVLAALVLSWFCGKAWCKAHAGLEYSGKMQVTQPANKVTLKSLSREIQVIVHLYPYPSEQKLDTEDDDYYPALLEEPPKTLPEGWLRDCGVDAFETVARREEQNYIEAEFEAIPLWHSWLTGLYRSEYYQPGIWTPGGSLDSAIKELKLKPDPNLPLTKDRIRFVQ